MKIDSLKYWNCRKHFLWIVTFIIFFQWAQLKRSQYPTRRLALIDNMMKQINWSSLIFTRKGTYTDISYVIIGPPSLLRWVLVGEGNNKV